MMSNCPNCGGVLDRAGHCGYCGTNVVPNLNIFSGNAFSYGSITELNINVTDPWGTTFTIPLRGSIDGVEVKMDMGMDTEVEFTFTGRIRE